MQKYLTAISVSIASILGRGYNPRERIKIPAAVRLLFRDGEVEFRDADCCCVCSTSRPCWRNKPHPKRGSYEPVMPFQRQHNSADRTRKCCTSLNTWRHLTVLAPVCVSRTPLVRQDTPSKLGSVVCTKAMFFEANRQHINGLSNCCGAALCCD